MQIRIFYAQEIKVFIYKKITCFRFDSALLADHIIQ